MDASKINFLGFKYCKLPIRTSLLSVAFWGKKKTEQKVVGVCYPPVRGYFFCFFARGFTLGLSDLHTRYHSRYLRFSHSPMMYLSEKNIWLLICFQVVPCSNIAWPINKIILCSSYHFPWLKPYHHESTHFGNRVHLVPNLTVPFCE